MSTSFLLKISALTFLSIAMLFPTISSAQSFTFSSNQINEEPRGTAIGVSSW